MLHSTSSQSQGKARTSTSHHRYREYFVYATGNYGGTGVDLLFQNPTQIVEVMKWISCYMALSRVRSLSDFRSIGLTQDIRELIDMGPPDGFLTRFLHVFENKISSTQQDIENVMIELGWDT